MSQIHDADELTRAVVIGIDHGVATLLVGAAQEEWDFPTQLLPPETTVDSIVLLRGEGYGLEVVGLASERVDSVEARLGRRLSQRRLARIA